MAKYLIIVDMQNDFVRGVLGSEEAEKIIGYIRDKILGHEGKVIFLRDTHRKDYLLSQEGKYLPVEHCIKDSWGWEFVDELKKIQEEKSYPIIEKNTFGGKGLISYLQNQKDVEEIEFVGVCTDICVVSNVLLVKAYFPEIPLIVDALGCAGVSVDSHRASLIVMQSCQVEIRNGD